MKTNNTLGNLQQLIHRLKNEDSKYARLSKSFQILYFILTFLFGVLIIIHIIEKEPLSELAGATCFLLSMLSYAFFFRKYYKDYNNVDYSQPTLMMLKKAAYRYQPFQRQTAWLIIPLLLIDAGLALNSSLGFDFIKLQLIWFGTLAFAVCIGLTIWYFRYKPLHDNAKQLIREIENV
ncbi:hypothetical protein SLH46_15520 [Draconibacterium sp. IB214405]|uniref:hypothetical protein n=1 Tax=Draconibacterium sp. IB214405 TaxID=3097352 RepID=UPI002A0E8479|nr:hypothetical protein [Draconibacterium sp. IB214405]MDX8340606.1 hypothetical protein [Draconibacterium sp. IB214405]